MWANETGGGLMACLTEYRGISIWDFLGRLCVGYLIEVTCIEWNFIIDSRHSATFVMGQSLNTRKKIIRPECME